MQPLRFDFDAPAIEAPPPFHGTTSTSRHASWTGARAVVETRSSRVSAYLQLLRQAGSLTDQEAAALLKWQLCSVNSVRGFLRDQRKRTGAGVEIVPDGVDLHTFTDAGGDERTTRRTKWRIAA